MAPVFGSVGTSSGGGNGTSCTIPVPSGVAAGDIIVVFAYIETTQAVTPDTGFVEATNSPAVVTGTQAHDLRVFWKRATGADSGSYAFTIAAGLAWRMAVAMRFTGCVSHGNPWDVTTSAIKTTTTTGATPAVSTTTKGGDRLLVWVGSFYNGDSSCTQPSGWTERADISGGVALDIATLAQPLQGASASITGTFAGNSATGAWMGALLPSASKFLAVF
jgi:hypothetical protein